jgi:hypothetical protein
VQGQKVLTFKSVGLKKDVWIQETIIISFPQLFSLNRGLLSPGKRVLFSSYLLPSASCPLPFLVMKADLRLTFNSACG